MRSLYFTFLSATLLLLPSCFVPQKIVKIQSEDPDQITWNYGRELLEIKDPDYAVSVNFEDYTKYELIFYLKLAYAGSDTILFNPANIYLISGNGYKISAVDPESEIFKQQIRLSKAESRRKNSILLAGALAVASTAAVAAISDNYAPTDDHNSTYIQDNTYIYINNRPDPNPILPPDIEFWKNHTLRKSTITKGFQVEGMLVFPRMDEMRDFRMIIPIKGQNREVAFRQRIYLP